MVKRYPEIASILINEIKVLMVIFPVLVTDDVTQLLLIPLNFLLPQNRMAFFILSAVFCPLPMLSASSGHKHWTVEVYHRREGIWQPHGQ